MANQVKVSRLSVINNICRKAGINRRKDPMSQHLSKKELQTISSALDTLAAKAENGRGGNESEEEKKE